MDYSNILPMNIMCYANVPNNLLYELSNVRFLSIKLECNNQIYNIVLHTANYNYYIVNTCINAQFIKYYLTHVLKEQVDYNMFKYKLELLDDAINVHSLNETHNIIIKKDSYEIVEEIKQIEQEPEQLLEQPQLLEQIEEIDDYVKLDKM
jgi:hypothetical protein